MLRDALGSAEGGALFFDLNKKDIAVVLSSCSRQARRDGARLWAGKGIARSQ